jgi:hypothetical protein
MIRSYLGKPRSERSRSSAGPALEQERPVMGGTEREVINIAEPKPTSIPVPVCPMPIPISVHIAAAPPSLEADPHLGPSKLEVKAALWEANNMANCSRMSQMPEVPSRSTRKKAAKAARAAAEATSGGTSKPAPLPGGPPSAPFLGVSEGARKRRKRREAKAAEALLSQQSNNQ